MGGYYSILWASENKKRWRKGRFSLWAGAFIFFCPRYWSSWLLGFQILRLIAMAHSGTFLPTESYAISLSGSLVFRLGLYLPSAFLVLQLADVYLYIYLPISHSVLSDSLGPHGLQHARLPCPSPTPRAYSNSCPIELVMSCNCLILCHILLLLPSIFPRIRVFSNESVLCIRWAKYWSFSFSISPSNEHSGLISLRINWFNLPTVQGTLKSLLQHHHSNTPIFPLSFLYVPILTSIHDYWKNHGFD